MKIFSLLPPPLLGINCIGHPPWAPHTIQERKAPIAGYPLWHALALYMSIGPSVLEGTSLFIPLPSPWIHTSDHSPHFSSNLLPIPFPLPGTSMSPNSIAGPHNLRRCCFSEVGYRPNRIVFHSFIFIFPHFIIYTLLHLRRCVEDTSSNMYLHLFVSNVNLSSLPSHP